MADVRTEASRLHRAGYTVMGVQLLIRAGSKKSIVFKPAWQTARHGHCMDAMFTRDDDALALLTGEASDLLAVDADALKPRDQSHGLSDAVQRMEALCAEHGLPDGTPTAVTPSGGRHYLFSMSRSLAAGLASAKNAAKCAGLTLDQRGDNGCLLCFPSRGYTWTSPPLPAADLQAAPAWLIALLNQRGGESATDRPPKRQRVVEEYVLPSSAFTAVVQQQINKLADSQKMHRVWPRSSGIDYSLVDRTCSCPLCGNVHSSNNYTARLLVEDAFTLKNYSTSCRSQVFGWQASRLISNLLACPATDDPHCHILRAVHRLQGREVVYTSAKRLLCFTDRVWEPLHPESLKQDVKSLLGHLLLPLISTIPKTEENAGALKALRGARGFLQKAGNVSSVVQTFQTLSFDPDIEDSLDTDPDLLAVGNGTVELPTGKLRPGKTSDRLSLSLAAAYLEDGPTPMIDAFFADVFNGDAATVAYVQRLLGYGITGHTREQVWAIWTGVGSNGKGVLMAALKKLLGPWCVMMPGELLFETAKTTAAGASTPHLQTLIKKRLAFKDEGKSERQNVLNEELIKTLTGSSTIVTRPLYKDFIEFEPTHLPVLLCNRRPRINVNDPAMMRRVVVVPFTNIYTSPDSRDNPFDPANPHHRIRDDLLPARLLSEDGQAQLLTWLVRGAVAWHAGGLGRMSEAIGAAFDSYREENDTLTAFIAERCTRDRAAAVNASDFLRCYNEHARLAVKQKELRELMAAKGFKYATTGGLYRGIALQYD